MWAGYGKHGIHFRQPYIELNFSLFQNLSLYHVKREKCKGCPVFLEANSVQGKCSQVLGHEFTGLYLQWNFPSF